MSLLTRGWGRARGLLYLWYFTASQSPGSRSLTPPSLGLEPGGLSEEAAVARSLSSGCVFHFFVPWELSPQGCPLSNEEILCSALIPPPAPPPILVEGKKKTAYTGMLLLVKGSAVSL